MKYKVIIFLLLVLAHEAWSQGCGITININPTVNLCAPGSTVLLPVITGDYINFSWSPTNGLSNPNALITTASVTESTTYTLRVGSPAAENLIVNGDFSMGNTGFESDYSYGSGGPFGLLSNEGQYAIANNTNTTHNDFPNCTDHTGGGGMMVVNGSGVISNLWCQDITVQPNTNYLFSAWVMSVISSNPARLQFSVNGINLGTPFNASSSICNWQNFASPWASGSVTTARICVVNTNTALAGNDFALDDISFREVCITEATVDVVVTELDAQVDVPAMVCRLATPVNPNDYFLPTTTTGGTWTLDGQPVITFVPAALSNGAHLLTYTVADGNCSDDFEATFTLATPPEAGTASLIRQCVDIGQSVTLDLGSSLQDADAGGLWSFQPGSQVGSLDANTGMFSTTLSGDFGLRYVVGDPTGVCPADTVIQRIELNPNPIANLPATATLDCIMDEIILTGVNLSTGNNINYSWQRDGQPLEAQFMSSLLVNRAGTYRLRVRNVDTACSSDAFTTVNDLSGELTVALERDLPTCQNPAGGIIRIAFATGGTPPYLASIDGVNFSAVTEFGNLAAGDYTVILQDAGGCEGRADANLPAPITPTLQLGSSATDIIPLGQTITLTLETEPPVSALDTIIWTPALPDSLRINERQWQWQPLVTTPYQVLIRDAQGCEATARILLTVRPEGAVFIPNAISPNDDGVNDRFMVFDQGAIVNINQLQIFDRWGGLVFSAKDVSANSPENTWDGRRNGRLLPPGVYVYAMEVRWLNGEVGQLQGEITLLY